MQKQHMCLENTLFKNILRKPSNTGHNSVYSILQGLDTYGIGHIWHPPLP